MAIFNVKDYGAYGDNVHNDTQAFIAASAALTAAHGGTLLIPAGTYLVGEQTFAGQNNKGYAYAGKDIITISNCTEPVLIEGSAAVLRLVDGLKFGSFDPVTGAVYNPPSLPFTNHDYGAFVGRMIVLVNNQSTVTVRNLELDGNNTNTILGGAWGDKGYQQVSYGVYAYGNREVCLSAIHTHHHCLDGVYIGQAAAQASATSPHRTATLINVRAEYNARQGLSWVGGNGLTAIGCKFNHTGKGAFGSSPQAGVDIEASAGAFNRNGLFINCEMVNNGGPNMGADSGDSADISFMNCTFLATTTSAYAALPYKPRMHFSDCTFSGVVVKCYGDPGLPVNKNSQGNATRFSRCRFTDTLTYQGQVYAPNNAYLLDLGAGSQGVKFNDCVVEATKTRIGYTMGYTTATNCQFYQSGSDPSAFRSIMLGHTTLSAPTLAQLDNSVVLGYALFNGNEYHQPTNMPQRRQQIWANNGNGGSLQRVGYGSSPTDFLGSDSAQHGDIVYNCDAVSGAPAGWVCVSSGAPGVWKAFATIAN